MNVVLCTWKHSSRCLLKARPLTNWNSESKVVKPFVCHSLTAQEGGGVDFDRLYPRCHFSLNPYHYFFQEIDIAAVHLSINSLREKFIDFSVPFMEAGLLFVVKGETHSNANKFFFLSPFSGEVW